MSGGMFGPNSRFLEHMNECAAGGTDAPETKHDPEAMREAVAKMHGEGPVDEKAEGGPG